MTRIEYSGPEKEGLLKFDSKIEAQQYNHEIAKGMNCRGTTKYWFPMMEIPDETTTFSKDEYASLAGIPKTVEVDEEGTMEANPKYEELDSKITVNKAVIINSEEVRNTYKKETEETI